MSTVAFIRRCLDAGMDMDTALVAAEAFEAEAPRLVPTLTPRQQRNRRYYENNRLKPSEASESKTPETISDAPLSLPPSPQTPQPPTHTRVCDLTTRASREREEAAFGRFWTEYPRKTAKADARKAFAKAWRKLPEDVGETLLSGGLERAKAAWTDAQFIPHAATWLNGERWQDEPSAVITLSPRKAHERPHPDAKFDARQANLARHDAGADLAARLHGQS